MVEDISEMDVKERVSRFLAEHRFLGDILKKRYSECDYGGHRSINGDFCDYCYRRLNYSAPLTDSVLEERKNFLYINSLWMLQ